MIHAFGAWRELLLLRAAVPLVYYAVATCVAARFFRRERKRKRPAGWRTEIHASRRQ